MVSFTQRVGGLLPKKLGKQKQKSVNKSPKTDAPNLCDVKATLFSKDGGNRVGSKPSEIRQN